MASHLLDYAVMALNDQLEQNSFRLKSAFFKSFFKNMPDKSKSTQSTRGRSKSKAPKAKKVKSPFLNERKT